MSTFGLLHKLRDLDNSAPELPSRLRSLLDDHGYEDCVANLKHNDPAGLIEFFDTVCSRVTSTNPSPKLA
jgi:hypothetical protein